MKNAILLVLVGAVVLMGSTAMAAPLTVPVKDFHLEDFQGKVVLLDFWASWCKPCAQSLPWLAAMQDKHGAAGLQVVAVNLDGDLAAADTMLEMLDDGIVVVHDPRGDLAARFQLEGMPSAFVFRRDGELAASHVGFLAGESANREEELIRLLQEGLPHEDN